MFVSPFTVSLGCDIAVIVVYLQRPDRYGGTSWLTIQPGLTFAEEMVDMVSLPFTHGIFIPAHSQKDGYANYYFST